MMDSNALNAALRKLTGASADPNVLTAALHASCLMADGAKVEDSLVQALIDYAEESEVLGEDAPYAVPNGVQPEDWRRFGADDLALRLLRLALHAGNDEEAAALANSFATLLEAVCEGAVAARGSERDVPALVRITRDMREMQAAIGEAEASVGIAA